MTGSTKDERRNWHPLPAQAHEGRPARSIPSRFWVGLSANATAITAGGGIGAVLDKIRRLIPTTSK
jgi:hypothetical protein